MAGGRPIKHELCEEEVYKLAAMFCTLKEMADFFGCSHDTLERRYASAIKSGRENAKQSLRRAQLSAALSGSVPMLIWLGKQYLDQREPIKIESAPVQNETQELNNLVDQMKKTGIIK